MSSQVRPVHLLVWGLLAAIVLSVAGVFVSTLLKYQARPLPVYGEVPNFTLTNQFGQAVALRDLEGRPWIADLIFTRCSGPCPDMTRKMKAIQDALPPDGSVKLVSLTADPDFDTPAVLKEYGARFGANPTNWLFLTGPKSTIQELAMQGLKLAMQDDSSGSDQIIHSTRLVLVDGRGQVRSVSFDGSDAQGVKEIVRAAERLKRER